MNDKTPAQRLAEKYIQTHGCSHGSFQHKIAEGAFEFALVEIRKRRDEIDGEPFGDGDSHAAVYMLFDDGAEFGPPKNGPTLRKEAHGVRVFDQNGDSINYMSDETYRLIQEHGPKLEDL